MSASGHPVGSLSVLLSSWIGVRALILAPVFLGQSALPSALNWTGARPHVAAHPKQPTPGKIQARGITIMLSDDVTAYTPINVLPSRAPDGLTSPVSGTSIRIILASPEQVQPQSLAALVPELTTAISRPLETPRHRPTLSAWLALRGSVGRASLATSGQLGGSQAGMRLTLPVKSIAPKTTLSLSARASMPVQQSRGKEAAMGISVRREGVVPLELGIERRIALDKGGRDAFALVAATGIYDRPIAKLTTVSGYMQAGIVGARRRDGFADGAISVDRHLVSQPMFGMSVGGGAWGTVQPGLSRLDIGPVATIRIAGPANAIRISGAWRFRVAGSAEPGSGPVITVGTDF